MQLRGTKKASDLTGSVDMPSWLAISGVRFRNFLAKSFTEKSVVSNHVMNTCFCGSIYILRFEFA
jgi:hypothetical protein